jgi:hypothetical protein
VLAVDEEGGLHVTLTVGPQATPEAITKYLAAVAAIHVTGK